MNSRDTILEATEQLVRTRSAHATTISEIAARANCAKGLINYHFGSKTKLIEALAERVVQRRVGGWRDSLEAANPHDAIEKSWRLLRSEAESGTLQLWAAAIDTGPNLTGQSVKSSYETFSRELGRIASTTIANAGLTPRIPLSELGSLLAAVVHGIGKMLLADMDPGELEGAYAAAWLGILSLTTE